MSARSRLADTNIAKASIVQSRNNIVGQYQNFMRESARDNAKAELAKYTRI
jgi:hypothetical protein